MAADLPTPSVIVVLALVPDRQYRDRRGIVDFEERDISRRAKRNHQLPQQGGARPRFAAGKRGEAEQLDAFPDRLQRVPRYVQVLLQQEIVEPDEIVFRVGGEPYAVFIYPRVLERAAASRRDSLRSTVPAGT